MGRAWIGRYEVTGPIPAVLVMKGTFQHTDPFMVLVTMRLKGDPGRKSD